PFPAQLGVTGTAGTRPVGTQITEFIMPNFDVRVGMNLGLYAQDQWRIANLTVNLGVRSDMLRSFVPAQCKPADYFSPELCSPKINNVPNWKDISPRFGLAYDVFGNGRTAVKGAVGRYVVAEGTSIAQNSSPSTYLQTSTTRTWNDANRDLQPDCNLKSPA